MGLESSSEAVVRSFPCEGRSGDFEEFSPGVPFELLLAVGDDLAHGIVGGGYGSLVIDFGDDFSKGVEAVRRDVPLGCCSTDAGALAVEVKLVRVFSCRLRG